jgi:tetratricopeptide (TPR) repeat protein
MSARNLNNTAEAERYLKPLTTSADPLIAGRANVEMGIIESQRGRHESAARYFDDAGDELPGDEAARALFQAGESCAAAGRTEMAKLYYRRALDKSSDAALRSTIESRLSFAGFTLQVGAFASRINADKAVAKAQPQAQRLGLDGPRVVTRNGPNGRALYVVQMGTFNSQRDAELARAKAGPGAVVARVTTN